MTLFQPHLTCSLTPPPALDFNMGRLQLPLPCLSPLCSLPSLLASSRAFLSGVSEEPLFRAYLVFCICMYVSSFIAYLPKMYELFPYYSISPWLKHLLPFEDQIVFSQLLNRGKGEKKMGDNQLPYLPPNHNYRPPPSYGYQVELY